MKKSLLIVLLALGFAFSATNRLYNDKVQHIKLFDDADIVLDSQEVYTATDVWSITSTNRQGDNNIIGTIGGYCGDSTGTDSTDVHLIVDAAYSVDKSGNVVGSWVPIDSVLIDTDDGSTYVQDQDTITVAFDPIYIRFRARNAGDHVDEKAKCTDMWFNPRQPTARVFVK